MSFITNPWALLLIGFFAGIVAKPVWRSLKYVYAEYRFRKHEAEIGAFWKQISSLRGTLTPPVLNAVEMHVKIADQYLGEALAPMRVQDDLDKAFDRLYWCKHCLDEAREVLKGARKKLQPATPGKA